VRIPRRRSARLVAALLGSLLIPLVAGAQSLEGLSGMTRPEDPLGMPSIGRIVGVLVLMTAVAFVALYALRRWRSTLEGRFAGARSIKVIERTNVGGSHVYLLQVDGARVLMTQYRGRVALLSMPRAVQESELEPKQ
jgi:flagellar biogenesis protein FliO